MKRSACVVVTVACLVVGSSEVLGLTLIEIQLLLREERAWILDKWREAEDWRRRPKGATNVLAKDFAKELEEHLFRWLEEERKVYERPYEKPIDRETPNSQPEAEVTKRVPPAVPSPQQPAPLEEKPEVKPQAKAEPAEISPSEWRVLNHVGTAILKYCRQFKVDAGLVLAIMKAESNFRGTAVSRAGAIGIMQLLPATAEAVGVNPYDLEDNIKGGVKYLHQLSQRFQSLSLIIAAYNAGPEAVEKYKGIPPYRETQQYVRTVLNYYGKADYTS